MARTPSVTSVRIDGAELRRARTAAGRSLADVAMTVGVTASFLARVERGERRINVTLLAAVLDVLDGAVRSQSGPTLVPSAPAA
jgi:transcriptional regulator with XRE-family HTH domain